MKEWLILIVDEKEDDLASLTKVISTDYQVVAARSKPEALQYLKTLQRPLGR